MSKPINPVLISTEVILPTDLVCFSHLRWNFVYQRPQHLLSRFAKHFRLFFIEEPVFTPEADSLLITLNDENIWIVVPQLKQGQSNSSIAPRQKELLSKLWAKMEINHYVFWYYTPMALAISDSFSPVLTIYDCMDELSAFKFAPPELKMREAQLLVKADLVFTGGQSLYEAKKNTHADIHPFPSSIDKEHFFRARLKNSEPADQKKIPYPRLGFYGVIDERMNIDLIGKVAKQKPDWQFVLIGPIVKIDQESLPKQSNIHYLGSKTYNELPEYLAGWNIALIPFALNESTRYISPTKTPEYLAAGKPVISSSIHDVVNPYGKNALVHIADTPKEFIQAAEKELNTSDRSSWLHKVDEFIADNSWDNTWKEMMVHLTRKLKEKQLLSQSKTKERVYV